jgi:hypothetical protein
VSVIQSTKHLQKFYSFFSKSNLTATTAKKKKNSHSPLLFSLVASPFPPPPPLFQFFLPQIELLHGTESELSQMLSCATNLKRHTTSDHHYHHLEKSSVRNTIKFELVES